MATASFSIEKSENGIFRPRRLGHANLFVSDYERSAEFYNQVVGFEEVYRQPDNKAAFLSNGNTYHDLALTDVRSKYGIDGQKPGLFHLAFELETERDLVDGYHRAVADGITFEFVMDHDVARSVYQNDPDGNMVEIYADIDKDWRKARQGIIIKEKPEWIPGVTSEPLTETNYPSDPDLIVLHRAIFHPKKVTHVALVAKHFEQMFDYYSGPIGLAPVLGHRDADVSVLRGAAAQADLTLHRASEELAPGLHHVGFEVWSEADLKRSIDLLRQSGIEPESIVDHPARLSVTIKDPDGLTLQFFVNRDWIPERLDSVAHDEARYLF